MSKKIYNLNTIYISERLQALSAYSNAINYDAALAVIQKDAGILLASLSPEKILAFLDACPTEILKNRPLALLVLERV